MDYLFPQNGFTALHNACIGKQLAVAEILIRAGADINIKSSWRTQTASMKVK
jgi:ankyrin repeat protein